MKNLLEQNAATNAKVSDAIAELQASINKQQQDRSGQGDQMSGQIQALNDTMDELKVRLAKLSKQIEDMQAAQQSMRRSRRKRSSNSRRSRKRLRPTCSTTTPCATTTAENRRATQNSTTTSSSIPTPTCRNSYFYLAEIQFKAGDFQNAVTNYELVLQNFPG